MRTIRPWLIAGAVALVTLTTCLAIQTIPPGNRARSVFVLVRLDSLAGPTISLRPSSADVANLPRSGAEIWRIIPATASQASALKNDRRVEFLEEMPAEAIAAFPMNSQTLQSLSADDQRAVQRLTQGAASAGNFRITAVRPRNITLDLLESRFAIAVVAQLLGSESLLLNRTASDSSSGDQTIWTGRTADGNGEATLVVRPLGITGRLRSKRTNYSVWPLPGGQHLVRREATQQFPPDHPPDGR